MKFSGFLLAAALAASLVLPPVSSANQATAAQSQTTQAAAASGTAAAPSPREIADAKAKRLVWVNTSTHVYHRDGSFYGKTKHGRFMTEDEAQKAGYRAAKTSGGSKKAKSTASSGQ